MSKKILQNKKIYPLRACNISNKGVYRLIDANINRLKEGLRVLEDIMRFILDDKKLTLELKQIRHQIADCFNKESALKTSELLEERQVKKDVGKPSILSELRRSNVLDVFLANAQRAKESVRVLEEFSKLFDRKTAGRLKIIRYKIYAHEKYAVEKLTSLCLNR